VLAAKDHVLVALGRDDRAVVVIVVQDRCEKVLERLGDVALHRYNEEEGALDLLHKVRRLVQVLGEHQQQIEDRLCMDGGTLVQLSTG